MPTRKDSSNTPEKPNILLFVTEQHRGDCLGIEDHPVLMTPNMDAIAGAGVRFSSAYSSCPTCIAARRSGGRMPIPAPKLVPDARVTVTNEHGAVTINTPGHEGLRLSAEMAHSVQVEKV